MSLGTPVICYLRDDLKELYPSWKECPIINANIDSLKDKILEIMDMTDEQKAEIGTQSMSYVEKYHSPEYVGEKLHTIIQEVLST
jgi:glycosyltransferase involved in cell wall biosynthesis